MNSLLPALGYVLDAKNDIWMKPSYKDICYSDGDEVEKRVASIVDQASDLSVLSAELNQHCTDWPSLYHLSSHRANIMRPFENLLTGDTLELGAGCGAITRYLGECGRGRVVAIEGSSRRAAITRSRTRDLKNVTVLAENFNKFQCAQKFDVITLIGVLEYANLFASAPNPHLTLLEHVYSLLKPEGKLIIAIENQLGLKYFAGFPEDHVRLPMYGLEGRYQKNQAQTFGKVTLANLFKEAKFENLAFFVPYPDYKLPHSIITEQGLKNKKFDAAAFAWQNAFRDAQMPRYRNFNLELTWPEVFKNKLLLDLANSFLIAASPSSKSFMDPSILAYHYSTGRKPVYCKETLFKYRKKVSVYYTKLSQDSTEHEIQQEKNLLIQFKIPVSSEYTLGTLLAFDFVKIVTKDGWTFDEVAEFIRRYLQLVQGLAQTDGVKLDLKSPYARLPGKLFDVLPHNIIIDQEGRPSIIDQEWILNQPIELGYLLFRFFINSLHLITIFGLHESGLDMTYRKFIDSTLYAMRLELRKKDFNRYAMMETEIQGFITNNQKFKEYLAEWWSGYLPVLNSNRTLVRRDDQINDLQQEMSSRDDQINHLHDQINHLHGQIETILSSRSWLVTKPLRFLGRFVRGRFREVFTAFGEFFARRSVKKSGEGKILLFFHSFLELNYHALHSLKENIVDCLYRIITRKPVTQIIAGDIPHKKYKKLCLMSHFDVDDMIDPYVVNYLTKLAEEGIEVFLISSCPNLNHNEVAKIKPYCSKIILKKNFGFDFACWQEGIKQVESLASYTHLILANDSTYGPLYSLDKLFKKMEGERYDLMGILESWEITPHLQSFFIVFHQKILKDQAFFHFFLKKVKLFRSQRKMIQQGELKLKEYFVDKGFHVGAFCDIPSLITKIQKKQYEYYSTKSILSEFIANNNPYHFFWDFLIMEMDFPFLKISVFKGRDDLYSLYRKYWPEVLKESQYDINLIKNHLRRIAPNHVDIDSWNHKCSELSSSFDQ